MRRKLSAEPRLLRQHVKHRGRAVQLISSVSGQCHLGLETDQESLHRRRPRTCIFTTMRMSLRRTTVQCYMQPLGGPTLLGCASKPRTPLTWSLAGNSMNLPACPQSNNRKLRGIKWLAQVKHDGVQQMPSVSADVTLGTLRRAHGNLRRANCGAQRARLLHATFFIITTRISVFFLICF